MSDIEYLIDVSSLSGLYIYDGWGASVHKNGTIHNRWLGEGSVRERRVQDEVIAPWLSRRESIVA